MDEMQQLSARKRWSAEYESGDSTIRVKASAMAEERQKIMNPTF